MIINSSKVKTEALLLLCRDLIDSYKVNSAELFKIDSDIKEFIDNKIEHLLKAINLAVQPIDYYLRNKKVSRIAIILRTHSYISKNLSSYFKEGDSFNPAMLCFALLCSWFAELSINEEDKEFIYFSIYPYGEVYDQLLLNISNNNYRNLNISMLNIAEDVVLKLYNYRLK